MNLEGIKRAIIKKYEATENDKVVPKFSTQFVFFEDKIVVLIPMHEYPTFMQNFSGLMEGIIREAEPMPKRVLGYIDFFFGA